MEQPKISLHVLSGWSDHNTMRVISKIRVHELVALIDSGFTNNFISERMENLMSLLICLTEPFHVKVANGKSLQCQGKFDNVHIMIQVIPFIVTLYALPFVGLDLVLGVHLLELLGLVVCNWKTMTMEFQWDNRPLRLQGIDGQLIQHA